MEDHDSNHLDTGEISSNSTSNEEGSNRLRPVEEYYTLRRSNVSETGESTESGDNQFLILSEDHFSELAEEELDSEGLPLEKRDVERAIRRYIRLIRLEETDSDPEKKKKLIIKLCQLKIRLNQMNEEEETKFFNGHRLNRSKSSSILSTSSLSLSASPTTTGDSSSSGLICDVCLKRQTMILLPPGLFKTYQPNLVLVCDFCDFKIHRNCISPTDVHIRRCPRVLFQQEQEEAEEQEEERKKLRQQQQQTAEGDLPNNLDEDRQSLSTTQDRQAGDDQTSRESVTVGRKDGIHHYSKYIEFSICPEVGLAKQDFKCAECRSPILLPSSRLCDYDGLYYCFKCHWGDLEKTPARILHNWDSTSRPVSRRSLQMITFLKRKPVLFDVLDFNPMLFGLVEDLPLIKRLRQELSQMVKYIRLCRQPNKPRLSVVPSYLISEEESNGGNAFSLSDLIFLDSMKKQLIELHGQLLTHITTECEGCQGKGFFCDHCRDKADLLFPFSTNTSACPECGTVYHRSCFQRKHKTCIRCQRRREKEAKQQQQRQLQEDSQILTTSDELLDNQEIASQDDKSSCPDVNS